MLKKITREITIPIAQYHNDKIYLSIEAEDGNLEEMSKELYDMVNTEYDRCLKQALTLLEKNSEIKTIHKEGNDINPSKTGSVLKSNKSPF